MKTARIIVLYLLLCGMGATKAQLSGVPMKAAHEVMTGETLYSISRKYGISVEDIRKANPKMGETLLAGSVIYIPSVSANIAGSTDDSALSGTVTELTAGDASTTAERNIPCKTMYEVGRRETVFSIARQFHLSEEELLRANPQIRDHKIKKGESLCIPFSQAELYDMQRESEQYAQSQREQAAAAAQQAAEEARQAQQLERIRVAVILPFALDAEKKTKEAAKMYDFYEGFLLAVDQLKSQGANVDVFAFEEPSPLSDDIDLLLTNPDLEQANLIVGPMRIENLTPLSNFARKHKIPLAVPFSSKASTTAASPVCYQINTATEQMYEGIFQQFADRYQHHNIVFVNMADRGDKPLYFSELQRQLNDEALTYQSIDMSELGNLTELITDGRRILIVPSSPTQTAFQKLISKLEQTEGVDAEHIDLFGFPEWQTFNEKNKASLRKFHATFFCTFYADPTSLEVQDFNQQFRSWFKHDPMNTYPQYGLLGYDTARFFVGGLRQHGLGFMEHSEALRVPALQNPMHFEKRPGNGAYVNSYYRFVSY